MSATMPSLPVSLSTMRQRSQLHAYQTKALDFTLHHAQCALWLDMGLGKTRQAVVAATHLEPNGPYLVVCPASVKQNWVREIEAVEVVIQYLLPLLVRNDRVTGFVAGLPERPGIDLRRQGGGRG